MTGASNLVEFSRKRRAILSRRRGSDDDNTGAIECIPDASDLILGDCLGQGSFSSVFALKGVRKTAALVDRSNSSGSNSNGIAGRGENSCGSSSSCDSINSNDEDGELVVKMLQPKLMEKPKLFANCGMLA